MKAVSDFGINEQPVCDNVASKQNASSLSLHVLSTVVLLVLSNSVKLYLSQRANLKGTVKHHAS